MNRFTLGRQRNKRSETGRRLRAQKSLDSLQIAKPCSARWEEMEGDEKVRFCAHCKLNVFNLSAMDLDEAARVIAEKDGRLCVRFYRRRDGTTLTQDCPVGVAAWRKRLVVAWSAAAGACCTMLAGLITYNPFAAQTTMGAPPPSQIPTSDTDTVYVGGIAPPPLPNPPAEMGRPMVGVLKMPAQDTVAPMGTSVMRRGPITGEPRSEP